VKRKYNRLQIKRLQKEKRKNEHKKQEVEGLYYRFTLFWFEEL